MNHKIVDQQNQKNKTKPHASCTYLSNIYLYMERVVFVYVTYYPKKYVNNTNEQYIKLMKLI